ncbi:hypothetical protein Glove_114g93 [Diversispora epigaea]|uniref:Protein kinase domain-containing protein n=1 Tax=Diversispora epigaea TaxID=1348612 RepID=A0A397J170_9GLOM|nr:hypothetical protein Glove_114g93 [Diversispora epigaea]
MEWKSDVQMCFQSNTSAIGYNRLSQHICMKFSGYNLSAFDHADRLLFHAETEKMTANKIIVDLRWATQTGKIMQIGLKTIHSKGFIRRNLHPDNLMIIEAPDSSKSISLGDLGL